jgi:pseudouridine-5'-phosphate glycosidase
VDSATALLIADLIGVAVFAASGGSGSVHSGR